MKATINIEYTGEELEKFAMNLLSRGLTKFVGESVRTAHRRNRSMVRCRTLIRLARRHPVAVSILSRGAPPPQPDGPVGAGPS